MELLKPNIYQKDIFKIDYKKLKEKNINNLNDWKNILQNSEIKDEYGRTVTYDDMLNKIVGDYKNQGKNIKIVHDAFYKTMLDNNDGLLYVNKDEKADDGSYVLVEGEFD